MISVPLGAMAGVACGYIFPGWTWGGMLVWVARRADEVTGWAALGAVLAGIVAFGALALSWPRRLPGTAGAAPQARSRTQPPGADRRARGECRSKKRCKEPAAHHSEGGGGGCLGEITRRFEATLVAAYI